MVSIHAPAGGATIAKVQKLADEMFQSTRPRGARQLAKSLCESLGRFQSTRPRGARHGISNVLIFQPMFQSTRPRGARLIKYVVEYDTDTFQSTRPRGARLLSIYALNSQYITYTISRTFSFASLLIYYSIYFFCKYFITRFCDPTSFLATLHVRVH